MKIAVCDDDWPIREELIRLIQRQVTDADITEYQSGEELLHAGADFDIYFLDIEMDSVSGMELARHIRERDSIRYHRVHGKGWIFRMMIFSVIKLINLF